MGIDPSQNSAAAQMAIRKQIPCQRNGQEFKSGKDLWWKMCFSFSGGVT
jgi:hypothetical protein